MATTDDLSKDLLEIIKDSHDRPDGPINESELMMKLVSYITRRDHKVYNHAFQQGEKKQ